MEKPDKGLDLGLEAKRIKGKIKEYARKAGNEEELKIKVEGLIQEIIAKFFPEGEEPEVAYEHRTTISGKRKDALYGTVIIEYKAPRRLDTGNEFVKAKEQVVEYIKEEAEGAAENFGKFFGVILDGYKISFVKFRRNEWVANEPTEVSEESVYRLLEAIISLRRKAIDADFLLADFGPESETSEKVISILCAALEKSTSSRTSMLFKDWRRVFSQVCAYSPSKLEGLVEHYGVAKGKSVDVEMLMYAVHTYYTLVMKLLTSEVISYFNPVFGSPLQRIENAYYRSREELKDELLDLEEGGIIAKIGIRNFLEADYFAWYLDEWSEDVVAGVMDIVKKLSEYDPATVELDPDRVKDLFKRLYQNLVPKQVRHDLGEYFTPDWLAELVLKEVEYDGNVEKRVLDPACGSGTFLVLAIKEVKDYAEEHFVTDKSELLRKIVGDVVGIDLNPLAVLASRANYVIALGDLIRYIPREGIEIPVYLADSILVSRKMKFTGEWEIYLTTSVGEFSVPHDVIDKNLLPNVLGVIETCVRGDYSESEFEKLIEKDIGGLKEDSIATLTELYAKIKNLEKEGKNRIWTRLLKNSFAPLLMGKFDFVVGNPPWVNWESLPEHYREDTKKLWDYYGLLEKTKGMGLGKVRLLIHPLFTARCIDRYLKTGGKFSFLIPFTTYKTQAGAGFRKFLVKGYWKDKKANSPCKVLKIHDLVTLYPFEGAINRTSLIVIEKKGETEFPIPCVMWNNPRSRGMDQEANLEEVTEATKQFDMILAPIRIGKANVNMPWMIIGERVYDILQRIMRPSEYKAHAGVCTWADGIFWINILSKQPSGFLVSNVGKTAKATTKKITQLVDSEFIFPVLRGKNLKKWYARSEGHILLPISSNGEILTDEELKINYPNTYSYFFDFSKELRRRSGYKQLLEKSNKPFYSVLRSKYAIMPYKVAWKHISGKISGKALFECSVISEEEKTIIPTHGVINIACESEDEAHYICSILNSSFASLIVMSYSLEVHLSYDILQNVYVPKFNSRDKIHLKLAELSKKAHALAKRYYEQDDLEAQGGLKEVGEEIDRIVAGLYGITDEELEEVRKTLRVLKGEDVVELEKN
ncbi:MAG: class I SAM-dependent DNA methyltransferase [Methanophagales archaeon ANME-1-THS]|nr:MAG: class I SAM-dependent DNA methyltransferase [Methanophagales archaeon ANME-1-THS]